MEKTAYKDKISILSLIFRGRDSVILLFLSTFLINIVSLALPLTLIQVYDRIIPYQALNSFTWLVVGCSVAITLEALLRISRDRIVNHLGRLFEHKYSCESIKHVLESNYDEANLKDPVAVEESFRSIQFLKNSYATYFIDIFFDLPFAILYIWVIYYINQSIGYFVIGAISCMTVLLLVVQAVYGTYYVKSERTKEEWLSYVTEIFSKIHFIKSFSLEEQVLRKCNKKYLEKATYFQKTNFVQNAVPALFPFFAQILMLGVIIVGAISYKQNGITLGVLTACMILSGRAFQPIASLFTVMIKRHMKREAKHQLNQLLNLPKIEVSTDQNQFQEQEKALVIKELDFKYPNAEKHTFKDLDFELGKNDFVVLTQSQSKGCTTFLNIIQGLVHPQKGFVTLAHEENSQSFKKISYVGDSVTVFKGTVIDNLACFNPHFYDKAYEIAELLGLNQYVSGLTNGYSTLLNRESNFSLPRTFLQLIGMTRALVTGPEILLLDHADSGLDFRSKIAFHSTLFLLQQEASIISVTDDYSLINLANHVYKFSDQKIKEIPKDKALEFSKKMAGEAWIA